MEEFPDANFYKACVPRAWRNNRPQFFNCGSRATVIKSYFEILDLYQQDPSKYKLNPDLLFALVDLDNDIASFYGDYLVDDTEALFNDLYQNTEINIDQIARHHLWVTGFIYKEAYFLQPELQDIFEDCLQTPQYDGQPLELDNIYRDIANAMIPEAGTNALQEHFDTVRQRLHHCPDLDTTSPETLQTSWLDTFQNSKNPSERRQLARNLMTVQQVKPQWQKIQPPADVTMQDWQFREQLESKIGDWYAEQPPTLDNHLACFFNELWRKIDPSR
ncbi:MAG: hypothetical protein F6J87_21720 [Spirulina sp. SIO3F2]|nr:hypothetical protein [Spirulina sp. SIO3F2]